MTNKGTLSCFAAFLQIEDPVTGEFVTYQGVFKAHLYRCFGGDRSESTRDFIICSFTYLFKSIA